MSSKIPSTIWARSLYRNSPENPFRLSLSRDPCLRNTSGSWVPNMQEELKRERQKMNVKEEGVGKEASPNDVPSLKKEKYQKIREEVAKREAEERRMA
ncbi:unnamed protein product [Sphagnum balticum]